MLVLCFCFLDSSLFHVAACNEAGFEFVKFARCCLLCFEHKFHWDNQFICMGFLAKNKGTMINEVLDFHFDCMKPGRADVIIKFEDSLKGLGFWQVFINRIIIFCRCVSRGIKGKHSSVDGVNGW